MINKAYNIPLSLTTVTTFSKCLALFLFITLPLTGFLLGMQFQKQLAATSFNNSNSDKYFVAQGEVCTRIRYVCPSGYEHFADNQGCGCQMTSNISPTPTPFPTDEYYNWETYTDESLRLSFRYPPEWSLSGGEGGFRVIGPKAKDQSVPPILEVYPYLAIIPIFEESSLENSLGTALTQQHSSGILNNHRYIKTDTVNWGTEKNPYLTFAMEVNAKNPNIKIVQLQANYSEIYKNTLIKDENFNMQDFTSTIEKVFASVSFHNTTTGTITDHKITSPVDGPDYLVVKTSTGETRVVYNNGEFPPCLNHTIRESVSNLKIGDTVEVYGNHISPEEINTCDSTDYYIRKTTPKSEKG